MINDCNQFDKNRILGAKRMIFERSYLDVHMISKKFY